MVKPLKFLDEDHGLVLCLYLQENKGEKFLSSNPHLFFMNTLLTCCPITYQ